MMLTMSGCNATAVADILDVKVNDTNVDLRIKMVDKPNIVSEFEAHPEQASPSVYLRLYVHGSGHGSVVS
jgi:hypothetical protein